MGDQLCIVGGRPLDGRLKIHGAKNAVLPMMAATLLVEGECVLRDCPHLIDVENMRSILQYIGCGCSWRGDSLLIDGSEASRWEMPEGLSKKLRSSIFLLGPVLARFGRAKFSYPGGCEIGNRPIDLHLKGLRQLNVQVREEHGYIICDGENMRGAQVHLDYPSVGATENLMMAAVAAEGETVIHNAAREPEVVCLQGFLARMGARISGAGTTSVTIRGGAALRAAQMKVIPDRIEAGTFLVAGAITGGQVVLDNVNHWHMYAIYDKLKECGCRLETGNGRVSLSGPKRPGELKLLETQPYPGFPTDMQAQFFALCTIADGASIIVENVFENRFKHAAELACMGANAVVKDRMAILRGVNRLMGADITARDLRGGAALALAGLCAEGVTQVSGVEFIDRGYERFEDSLCGLGANIRRVAAQCQENADDDRKTGKEEKSSI